MSAWIKELKVGDKVGIQATGYGPKFWPIAEVVKVGGRIRVRNSAGAVEKEFNPRSGKEWGSGAWDGACLRTVEEANQHNTTVRPAVEKLKAASRLRALIESNLARYTTAALNAAADALENGREGK